MNNRNRLKRDKPISIYRKSFAPQIFKNKINYGYKSRKL